MKKESANKHFVFIIGTRAQLIKVAPVIIEFEKRGKNCTILMTGQHKDTIQDIISEFRITSPQIPAIESRENATVLSLMYWLPKAYIGITKSLKSILINHKKIDVLVHGDTLSTFLGALAGKRTGARIVHLESGLTSQNLLDPFPEEILRRVVFRLTDIAMCPDKKSFEHMKKKYSRRKVVNTKGNTIIDSIRLTGVSRITPPNKNKYIIASIHRFQNIYKRERLHEIIKTLEEISKCYKVFFVLHPATRKRLEKSDLMSRLESNTNIDLLPRLGYAKFLSLAAKSYCVLTDGGSNQEELSTLGVPTIILRKATERSDGLGENAIMEDELGMSIASYIKQGGHEALERKEKKSKTSPSYEIIKALTEAD